MKILLLLLTTAFLPLATVSAKEPHVLMIGVDGMRTDARENAATPNMDKLIAGGAFTAHCLILGDFRGADTASGPGWSSTLTGTWPPKHGVIDNGFKTKNFTQYPHFFHWLKQEKPDARTISLVSWDMIEKHIVSDADVHVYEDFPVPAGQATGIDLLALGAKNEFNVSDGGWHHVVAQRQGGTITIYVDGRKAVEAPDTAKNYQLEGGAFYFGRDTRDDETKFDGEIGRARLWKRSLTEAEIQTLAGAVGDSFAAPSSIPQDALVLNVVPTPATQKAPLIEDIASLPAGDFALESWFKTTDTGRNILMGNYASGQNSMNLELHTDNRVRLFMTTTGTKKASKMALEAARDEVMASNAARILTEDNPTAIFVYFHQVDANGHSQGFDPRLPAYLTAIENVDRAIGTVVDAVRSRPTYADEDWLIIISSDHGGYDRTHRGGHDMPDVKDIALIVNGAPYPAGSTIATPVYLVDIVPTVLRHLGLSIDPAWGLDGKPIEVAK